MGYAFDTDETNTQKTEDLFDLEGLFLFAEDVTIEPNEGLIIDRVEELLAQTDEGQAVVRPNLAGWSFVLFRTNGTHGRLIDSLEKEIKIHKWDAKILNWRQAAGLSAQAVFALQYAFYIGMVFIAVGAILVIMNALVISVLERSAEIGTMRGIGAGKAFIRKLFIAESMLLTVSASIIGLLLGIIICFIVATKGIAVENELFVNLFGGNVIAPSITLFGILFNIAMAFIIAALAWIYPVSIAMHINPASVMGKE